MDNARAQLIRRYWSAHGGDWREGQTEFCVGVADGEASQPNDVLRFRLEKGRVSGNQAIRVVCEGIVLEAWIVPDDGAPPYRAELPAAH